MTLNSKDSTSTLLLKQNTIIKDKTLCATFLTACYARIKKHQTIYNHQTIHKIRLNVKSKFEQMGFKVVV